MSKRWSIDLQRPYLGNGISLLNLSADWLRPAKAGAPLHDAYFGWLAVTFSVFGFGFRVTRWIAPDVYGDGGVA